MYAFKRLIDKIRLQQNILYFIRSLLTSLLFALLCFDIYMVVAFVTHGHKIEMFYLSVVLRCLIGGLFVYFVIKGIRQFLSVSDSAKYIDIRMQDKADTLQNAFELSRNNEQSLVIQQILAQADDYVHTIKVYPSYELLKELVIPILAVVLGTLILFGLNTDQFKLNGTFFFSCHSPITSHEKYLLVEPGNVQVKKSTDVLINVVNMESDVDYKLFYKVNSIWRESALIQGKKTFYNLDYSFQYYVKSRYGVSDTFFVEVVEKPVIKDLTVRYNYPSYTGIKPETESNSDGNITALKHTVLQMEIHTNNPLKKAEMIFAEGTIIPMQRISKNGFKASFKLLKDTSYHFALTDQLQNQNEIIQRTITIVQDKAPEIEIIYPGRDTTITQNMMLPIHILASDDFGLNNLKLFLQLNDQTPQVRTLKEDIPNNLMEYEKVLDIGNFTLLPGERILYWAEISDNSQERQKTISKKYVLRFPSIEEIFNEVEQSQDTKKDILQETKEKSQKLKEELDEKRREFFKKNNPDWEDKKEIQQLVKKQDDLNKTVEKVAQEYQNMIEKLQDNQAVSKDMIEKMQKIQELMDDISNDDLKQAMQKLQDAFQNMDKDVMKKAMENFKFSMEDFNTKLEKTISLLESIKKEQAMQKAAQIASEMEKMQNQIMKETQDPKSNMKELAKQQADLENKLQSLKEQMKNTKDMLDSQKDKDTKQAMEDLEKEMEQDNLEQDIQDSAEQMQKNSPQSAAPKQKSAAAKMKKVASKLSQMKQDMAGGDSSEMVEAMQRAIKELLVFTQKHEMLVNRYVNNPFAILPDMISNYEGLGIILQKFYSIPQVALFVSQKFVYDSNYTVSTYRDFFVDVNDAKNLKITDYLRDITKGLNLMIYDLMQSLNNMQQGGGGSGGGMQSMMQMMQQMGQEQMAMNALTQQMMQQLGKQGQRVSDQGRGQMQRLAQDEQRLADNLKRALQNNPEAQKQANAIQQMINDLESVSKQLNQGRVDQSTVEKQERILSRMLDSEKSIHKREFSNKRKAESGQRQDWKSPDDLKQQFDIMKRKALREENYKKFPKAYQDVVKEYMKRINAPGK